MKTSAMLRLQTLTLRNNEAHERFSNLNSMDSTQNLTTSKRAGWCRILSSVATTESVEQTLMTPLEKGFKDSPEILRYLESHKQDEMRHHETLNRYLKNTFHYVKLKRTLSDQIIYDLALPQIAKLFQYKPIYGLSMLLFFEIYGIAFYKTFRAQARADQLPELAHIVQLIEKDELRHLSGLDTLYSYSLSVHGPCSWFDRKIILWFLKILVLDVNMSRWAFHNRKVRAHAMKAGLDPDVLTKGAYSAAREVCKRMTQKEALC